MLKVLMAQIGIGAALTAVFWGLYGTVAGYSALLGSLTCVLPNAFLALRLAVPRRDPGAKALIRAAWVGELGKLGLTVLMFSVVFLLVKPLSAAALRVPYSAPAARAISSAAPPGCWPRCSAPSAWPWP